MQVVEGKVSIGWLRGWGVSRDTWDRQSDTVSITAFACTFYEPLKICNDMVKAKHLVKAVEGNV